MLSIDSGVKKKMKIYAKRRGLSISAVVEIYFSELLMNEDLENGKK